MEMAAILFRPQYQLVAMLTLYVIPLFDLVHREQCRGEQAAQHEIYLIPNNYTRFRFTIGVNI